VRNRYYAGHCDAFDWAELGLNRITERRYRKIVEKAGFRRELYRIETSKNLPLAAHIPFLRNLFILGIKSVLVKPTPPPSASCWAYLRNYLSRS
jgi:hypothetical protein